VTSNLIKKPEKTVGYVLLAFGLVVVIIPIYFGFLVLFSGSSAVPKILETPVLSFNGVEIAVGNQTVVLPITEADINGVMERMFQAVNLVLFLVVAVVLISAGSVLMGKGVSLIKEVKLKVVREQAREEVEVEGKGGGKQRKLG
jgi:hypothetical protein